MGLLFGNEKHGLDPRWIELCDRKLTIPMAAGADSLNVAVAAGIFFHHLRLASRTRPMTQTGWSHGVTGETSPTP